MRSASVVPALLLGTLGAGLACAQDNYEIQVYGADLVPPGHTMVELHSNFTFEGSKTVTDGVLPDEHALHETIEITEGITPWFETGFYIFMSYRADEGYQWVGDHIRPRVAVLRPLDHLRGSLQLRLINVRLVRQVDVLQEKLQRIHPALRREIVQRGT